MSKTLPRSNFLILVLVLVALFLGYLIYKQKYQTGSSSTATTKISPTPAVTGTQKVFNSRRPTPAGLSADEKILFSPPGRDATQKEKVDHFAIVRKLGVESKVLDLNKCQKPTPLVMSVQNNANFQIRNSDTVEHVVWINDTHQYKVPANSTKTVKAAFGKGPGSYGYICDDVGGVVGFFLVNP